ncbi:helix-turn-helix domain-containing protein [Corynebacterium meridianum]|uniref:Helix-turn-helix domain-containing protein n=1 Tax=Corynebacterium meridianum TaxID=2765363 RepID=A0A934I8G5_9CORY|nr:helix-turn-helix domain-containing protein [Corynebacterium meridianum]MBI8990204.1 helix-turn-helix domain-containing protein [Corynebacterium meridianum]
MATKAPIHVDPTKVAQSEVDAVVDLLNNLPLDSELRGFLQSVIDANHRGAVVTAFAQDSEFSPNQAAKVLGMSRPHLLKFIRNGVLKCRRVGTHQRISYEDLMDFKMRREQASKDVAKALATDLCPSRQISLTDEDMAELDNL